MQGSTPAHYGAFLEHQLRRARNETDQEPVAFLNAWNEWAEGAYLESDETSGFGSLEATRDAVKKVWSAK